MINWDFKIFGKTLGEWVNPLDFVSLKEVVTFWVASLLLVSFSVYEIVDLFFKSYGC